MPNLLFMSSGAPVATRHPDSMYSTHFRRHVTSVSTYKSCKPVKMLLSLAPHTMYIRQVWLKKFTLQPWISNKTLAVGQHNASKCPTGHLFYRT